MQPRMLVRPLLTALTLTLAPGIALVLAAPSPAMAQAVYAGPMIELLPGGEVVGDGLTPVTLHVLAYGAKGKPLTGLQAKATTDDGGSASLQEVQAGLYRVTWTPSLAKSKKKVTVTFKGRTSSKESFNKAWAIPVQPPLSQSAKVTANPPQLTLGQDKSATINIKLSAGASGAAKGAELTLLSTSGEISNITDLGDGNFSALFNAPNKQFPHLALVTVADKRDPSRTFGYTVLPLVGKANFPVVGMPNSRVIVRIGDREFGPIQADASGRAQVPIIVSPGAGMATVVSVAGDKKTEEPLDLQVPASKRTQLFPMHGSVPADPSVAVTVRALVTTQTGEPDTTARVAFSSTAGTIGPSKHEGNGVYSASFAPPFGNTASKATVQVTVEGAKKNQSDAITLNLVPARPASLNVTPEPAQLSADAAGFKVFSKVVGPDGVGMSGRQLAFSASGANVKGAAKDLGNGDYQAQFATTGSGPVELVVTAKAAASGNPLRRVLVFPASDHVLNDGQSSTLLTVLTLDEFGYPVAGTPIEFKIAQGDGNVPVAATTDSAGIAQVHYTAGTKAGLVNIQVKAKGHTGGVGLVQSPASAAPGFPLPMSGSQDTLDLASAWRKIVTTTRIEREGMVGAPITAASSSTVGAIANIGATAEPATVAPGGKVLLKVVAQDAEGRGASGQQLEFIASAGSIGAVQDLGGGNYQTTLTVPVGVAGEVKISVTTAGSNIAGFLKVPVSGASSWQQVAATPTGEQAEEQPTKPPKEKKPKKEKQPKDNSEQVWLRAGAGVLAAQYHYNQEALVANGRLYNKPITFGGGVTPPAGQLGLQANARMWLPPLRPIGAEVSFRSARYTVQLPEFSEPIVDWVSEIQVKGLARYPWTVGKTEMHAGVRAGFAVNDFIIYTVDPPGAEEQELSYGPFTVPGFVAGAEVGTEIDKTIFGIAGIEMGLVDFTGLYSTQADLKLGWAFIDNMYVQGNVGLATRNTKVYAVEGDGGKKAIGELNDSTTMFGLGIGYQM